MRRSKIEVAWEGERNGRNYRVVVERNDRHADVYYDAYVEVKFLDCLGGASWRYLPDGWVNRDAIADWAMASALGSNVKFPELPEGS